MELRATLDGGKIVLSDDLGPMADITLIWRSWAKDYGTAVQVDEVARMMCSGINLAATRGLMIRAHDALTRPAEIPMTDGEWNSIADDLRLALQAM